MSVCACACVRACVMDACVSACMCDGCMCECMHVSVYVKLCALCNVKCVVEMCNEGDAYIQLGSSKC